MEIGVETKRQTFHMLMGFLPFLLKYLPIWCFIGMVFFALIFILLILPRFSNFAFRTGDIERGYPLGAVYYTISIILLLLIFPVYIAASAWAILAFGDGASTLFGMHYGKKTLFWNRQKSYTGFLSFVLFAWAGSAAVIFWLSDLSALPWWQSFDDLPTKFSFMPLADTSRIIITSFLTSFFCAVVESLPTKLNDNLTVPISGAAFMFFFGWVM